MKGSEKEKTERETQTNTKRLRKFGERQQLGEQRREREYKQQKERGREINAKGKKRERGKL